ncbi:MAG: DNA-binding protein [Sphingobacteriia bacterium]|nr:DNA-binding protein [Sphingobacteriia bacterium]
MSLIATENICGTAEVAEMLGIAKQRIHALRKNPEFPQPIIKIAATPIWDRLEIAKWATRKLTVNN